MSDMKREEEIRQAAQAYYPTGTLHEEKAVSAFIRGAKWADDSRPQSYSKQELRDMGFAFDLNGNVLSPNHLAEKAAHYVIEKASKWLEEKNEWCMYELEMILGGKFIEDFKKAMEE